MRTFIIVCLLVLILCVGAAYATGIIAVRTEHPQGRYVVTLTIHTHVHIDEDADEPAAHASGGAAQNGAAKVIVVQPQHPQ